MIDPSGVFEIDDIGVLEVLNNRTRLRILSHLETPSTVRTVAEAMNVPVTRLYYHINLLEDVGVIEVVERRKSGAMIERVYQCVARVFRPGPGIFENTGDFERVARVAADTVLDGARLDAEAGLLEHLRAVAAGRDRSEEYPGTISRTVWRINRAQAVEFITLLEEFVADWRERAEDAAAGDDVDDYGLSIVFFPMVGPMKGDLG